MGHKNILKYCPARHRFLSEAEKAELAEAESMQGSVRAVRVSDESLKLHDDTIIDNINSTVAPGDTVWDLGDFCFSRSFAEAKRIRDRIQCRNWHLLRGNHDNPPDGNQEFWKLFSSVDNLKEVVLNGQRIVLCHFAMKTWDHQHHGSWQLFGHSHSTLPDDPKLLSFDAGVDGHDFFPWSFEQIRQRMERKTNGMAITENKETDGG